MGCLRILYINHYAGGPRYGMEFRPYYLAREWVRAGHEVLILAASFSHVRANQPDVLNQPLETIEDGIRCLWYPTPAYAGNGIGRVRNMLAFLGWLYRDGIRVTRSFQPDVVIASSTYPMDIWPARRMAKHVGARLVFEVHDLWPLSPMELGGMSRWHPFILWVQWAEDTAYHDADVVVSLLPKVQDYMQSRGLLPEKLHIIPNGISLDEWQGVATPLPHQVVDLLTGLKTQGKKIIGYAGSHGIANALDNLLAAAALLQGQPIAFVLVGDGPEKIKLQHQASAACLKDIFFVNPVAKKSVPELLEWFDIVYIGWKRMPLYRFGIAPNKLMDYMMAARPVLMAIDAGNDPVQDSGCGQSVNAEDPPAIAEGIKQLLAVGDEERLAMGLRGKAYVMANHTYPVLAKRFINAFGSVNEIS